MSVEKPLEVFVKPKQRHVGETFAAHAALFEGDDRIEAAALPDGILISCIWYPDLDVAAERLQSRFPEGWVWSEPMIQLRHEVVNYNGQTQEIVLEPYVLITVSTPAEFVGNVMGDLCSRRALFTQQMEDDEHRMVLTAEAPLSELVQYSNNLSKLTSGTGKASATFLDYRRRPFWLDPPPDGSMSAALRA